jgi:hypothetical protein
MGIHKLQLQISWAWNVGLGAEANDIVDAHEIAQRLGLDRPQVIHGWAPPACEFPSASRQPKDSPKLALYACQTLGTRKGASDQMSPEQPIDNEVNQYLEGGKKGIRDVAFATHDALIANGCHAYFKTIYIGYDLGGEMVAALYKRANHVE